MRSSESSCRRGGPAIPTPSPPRHTARTLPSPCPPPPSSAPPSGSSSHGRCARWCRRSRGVWTDRLFLLPFRLRSLQRMRSVHLRRCAATVDKSRDVEPVALVCQFSCPRRLACQPKLAGSIQRRAKVGADVQDRTGDLVLTKDALCLLSYIGPLPRAPSRRFSWQALRARSARASAAKSAVARLRHVGDCNIAYQISGLPIHLRAARFGGQASLGLPTVAREASEGWSGRRGSNPRPTAWKAVTLPLSYSRLRGSPLRSLAASAGKPASYAEALSFTQSRRAKRGRRQRKALSTRKHRRGSRPTNLSNRPARQPSQARWTLGKGWWGGEGSNLRSPKAAGLQPAAIDRSATSPNFRCRASGVHAQLRGRRSECLGIVCVVSTVSLQGDAVGGAGGGI